MNKQKIGSIIVVLLFVISSGGIVLLMGGSSSTEPTKNPSGARPPIPQEAMESYTASGISAKVKQLFPVLTVSGVTNESEIILIDKEIGKINGIRDVRSQFRQNEGLGSGLIYVGTIRIESIEKRDEVIKGLREVSVVQLDEYVSSALIELPQTITLTSTADSTITKEQTFDSPLIQGFVSLDTKADDEIEVNLQVVINGEAIVNQLAFEEKNISLETKNVVLSRELAIKDLGTELRFNIDRNYEQEELNKLSLDINAIENIQDAMLLPNKINPELRLYIGQSLTDIEKQDLNKFLHSLPSIKSIILSDGNNEVFVFIDFDQNTEYLALKGEIGNIVKSMKVENYSIIDPIENILGIIMLENNDAKNTAEKLNELFLEKQIVNNTLVQKSTVYVEEPLIDDENKTYEFTSQDVEAWVHPDRKVGDILEFDLGLNVIRNKVDEIQAAEKMTP